MSRRRTALTAAALAAALAGCSSSSGTGPADEERAAALFAAQVPYLGDNSKVAALVSEVGPAPAGSYTLELHTATAPLGLSVDLETVAKPFATTDLREPATLLLGLIRNLDEVTFRAGSDTWTLTAGDASTAAGFDVKRLGQDRQALADYLDSRAD